MKRRLDDRRETPIRPTIRGSCPRQPANIRPFFRFPSGTRYFTGHTGFHTVPFGQVRPFSVQMNPRLATICNAVRMRSNRPDARAMVWTPRSFSWRSAVECGRIPGTSSRFQEIPPNFARVHPPQSTTRFSYVRSKMLATDSMARKWAEVLPEGGSSSASDFQFSIVSYNILSDKLLFENKYLYEDCSEYVLSWEFRKQNLLKELLSYNADILCLQEVDADHYETWFEPKLNEAGYGGLYNQRTGGKPDGCATFYRCSKFTLVNKKLVKYYTINVPVLDKDNVGIVVLLKPNIPEEVHTQRSESDKEPRLLCVANTHLLFNKKRGDIKLAQLAYLFAEVDSLAMLRRDSLSDVYCPVILCGDLNSIPYSPLHYFLTKGELEYGSRIPSIISGQLLASPPSPGRYISTSCIRLPLLPWNFGVTLGCQWRNLHSTTGRDEENSSFPYNPVVERVKHDWTNVLTIPFQFKSVYNHHLEDGTPEVTTCHSKACCNVDYIFYTLGASTDEKSKDGKRCSHEGTLTLLRKLQLLGKSDFNVVKQLPNQQYSSDHLSLLALFKLS